MLLNLQTFLIHFLSFLRMLGIFQTFAFLQEFIHLYQRDLFYFQLRQSELYRLSFTIFQPTSSTGFRCSWDCSNHIQVQLQLHFCNKLLLLFEKIPALPNVIQQFTVSQIWSFTTCPLIQNLVVANQTPIVGLLVLLNWLVMQQDKRELFPTDVSPTSIYLKRQLNSKESSIIVQIYLCIIKVINIISDNGVNQFIRMIRKCFLRMFFKMSTGQHTIPEANFPKPKRHFKIRLNKIHEKSYFGELINNEHPLSETNRMLRGILLGGTQLNKVSFQQVFSKYYYYIEHIREKNSYTSATITQKCQLFQNVTDIYNKFGKLTGSKLFKTFNKICDDLNNSEHQSKQISNIEILSSILKCVSRYNTAKSLSLYKSIERKIISPQILSQINLKATLNIFEFFSNCKFYNRLLFQTSIDVLNKQWESIPTDTVQKIAIYLAYSHFPVNKSFFFKILGTVDKIFKRGINPESGMPYPKNSRLLKSTLKLLQSISMIEINMNLASAYLPQLNKLFEVEIHEFTSYLRYMDDLQMKLFCNLLRKSSFYAPNILNQITKQLIHREVYELRDIQNEIEGKTLISENQQRIKKKQKALKVQTFCVAMHMMAYFNFRSQPFIEYFISLVQLIVSKEKIKNLDNKEPQNEENEHNALSQIKKVIKPKYYSRIIWSICVLGTRHQISKLYPILQNLFILETKLNDKKSPEVYETLNFYYSYLLLKTYLPSSQLSFEQLKQNLLHKELETVISKTHHIIYNTLIQLGIPALKQYNISNLICDIFIPLHKSFTQNFQVSNVVLDIHGNHHFFRNAEKLKGGGALKAKILKSQGYIYQYIGVHQWDLVEDKKQYLRLLMDEIAEKFGKQRKSDGVIKAMIEEKGKSIQEKNIQEVLALNNEKISIGRKKRRIRSNSQEVEDTLNKRD